MNINNAFPSKYLKSGDITDDADLILTIKTVTVETVGQGDEAEQKPIIHFDETDKGLVLNKTNSETISRLYTPETDNWTGKRISVFATEVDFAGKQTLALRVRMKPPTAQPKAAGVLFHNTSALHPDTVNKWAELVTKAKAFNVAMNFDLDETDTPEQLAIRVTAVKAAIAAAI